MNGKWWDPMEKVVFALALFGLVAIVVLLAMAVFAPCSDARTTVWTDDGSATGPRQRWLDRSRMPAPETSLRVRGDSKECGDWKGSVDACAWIDKGQPTVVLTPYVSKWRERMVLYHEVGHIFARLYLTEQNKEWLKNLFRMTDKAWYSSEVDVDPVTGERSLPTPSEAFADLYAECSYYTPRFIKSYGRDRTVYGVWGPKLKLRGCGYMRLIYKRGKI